MSHTNAHVYATYRGGAFLAHTRKIQNIPPNPSNPPKATVTAGHSGAGAGGSQI